jgi:hypothetical protein
MRQRIAAFISAIALSGSIGGVIKEKLSYTEAGATVMAVLAYWSDPPKSLPGSGIEESEDKGN